MADTLLTASMMKVAKRIGEEMGRILEEMCFLEMPAFAEEHEFKKVERPALGTPFSIWAGLLIGEGNWKNWVLKDTQTSKTLLGTRGVTHIFEQRN